MLSLIVARARNGAIGRDNSIPWDIPEDLRVFQRETLGGALIMGRRTWESLPVKPLPRRLNIVVTSRALDDEVRTAASVEDALSMAQDVGYTRLYGIGGAGIYRALLPRADRLLITEVDLQIPDADAFFPAFEPANWHLKTHLPLTTTPIPATLHEYLRAV